MLKRVTHFSSDFLKPAPSPWRMLWCIPGVLLGFGAALAQVPVTSVPTSPATAPASPAPALTVPNWKDLSPQQRESLKPLASNWDSLSDLRKRKWLAMAQNYERMAQPEREKLHARMADWAALKPKEREQARLNFAETKKIAPSERAANWEAYQALTDEEKQALAKRAKSPPAGAAVAAKPVPKDKLVPVPVTRRTPEDDKARLATKPAIDRNTLLPIKPSGTGTPRQ